MYFRSHVYCTKEITGSSDPYLLFGSLFGDFHYTKVLPDDFQSQYLELLRFLKTKYPKLVNIGVGLCLHEVPIGMDRFIHQSYRGREGYAFQFKEQLFSDTKRVLGFDDNTTILMTHFLVENALEHKILREHPETEDLIRRTFDKIDVSLISKAISEFYQIKIKDFEQGFQKFRNLVLNYDYSTFKGQAEAYANDLKALFNKDVDSDKIAELIKQACSVIEPSAHDFLKECIEQCKKDFHKNFSSFDSE